MTAARLQWRPLLAGELDHERLWLGVGVAAGAFAAASVRLGVRPPPCLFHLATGFPCPGCGSTRAVLQLAHGHAGAAFAFNPLTTIAIFAAALYCVYAGAVLALRWPRLRVRLPLGAGTSLRIALFAVIAANWWWVLAHGR